MRRKLLIILALFFVTPGLLFTVSCAKKVVKEDETAVKKQAEDDASIKVREAENLKKVEMERQRKLEEQRLAEEAKQKMMAAKNKFLNEDVHFDYDKSNLRSDAQEVLKSKAGWLRDNPDVNVTIEGHCDERGTNAYNLALGDRRANSAKSYLIDLGIAGSRLTTISYGEERPLVPGHNEEAWAKNRRAHFAIK
jgi:peptidoglycan-associated lipoprotein